jgi:hypothetical protein
VVRIARALVEIRVRNGASAAGLVHDDDRHIHDLAIAPDRLDQARGPVGAGARSGADCDLDRLLRLPRGLCVRLARYYEAAPQRGQPSKASPHVFSSQVLFELNRRDFDA